MTTPRRAKAKEAIAMLVEEFDKGKRIYKDPRRFDEAKVRAGFIDPFFEALDWPVKDSQRRFGKEREVIVEDRAGKGNKTRPDYGFYSSGTLKFYVEAKAPSHEISQDKDAILQLKTYVWTQRAPLGLLSDFEELVAFHGAFRPRWDEVMRGRVPRLTMKYAEYPSQFDLLYDTLSKEAVGAGAIERLLAEELAANVRQQKQIERDLFKARGAVPVDAAFLESLSRWREDIARELAHHNDFKDGSELTEAVQRFLDRLVFARVVEDRGIERSDTLGRALEKWESSRKKSLYSGLIELFERLAVKFNGTIFREHPLSDNALFRDSDALAKLVQSLYFPECSYRFDVMSMEVLGSVYEQFLGSVIRVTDGGHRAKIEQKPEVRHAGGVYSTPPFIVERIVDMALVPLLKDATISQALQLRVLDPACGSGSFLIGAYQYLMEWHLRCCAKSKDPVSAFPGVCYLDQNKGLQLTLKHKTAILTDCIYGVDIDQQAVEVAQMSLYLKLMEDETEEVLALQRSLGLLKTAKYLPPLSKNIRCGNSLISTRDLDPAFPWAVKDEHRINAFDWNGMTEGFGEIVNTASEGGRDGFDAIVGNPPYIRVQALNQWAAVEAELYKKLYHTAAEGNCDLYVPFVERSLGLLRPGGRLGFILPTKWWQATYGERLRGLLAKGGHYAETVDFAHEQVFEDPTTYTCLSIFTKTPSKTIAYWRMSPEELKKNGASSKPLWAHSVPCTELGAGPWYLGVRSSLRELFNRLRSSGPALGDKSICLRVFQGLKTSLDPVYVLDVLGEEGKLLRVHSKALNEELELEREPLKWIVKGKQMKQFAHLPSKKVVLVPYTVDADEAGLIPPGVLKRKYPKTWAYLIANRTALEARERGRMKHANWYAYIYPKNLTLFRHPKLLTADLANRMSFSLDREGGVYLLGGAAGGYGLLPARAEYANPLLAILNSSLSEWILRPPGLSSPFRGGWFSCEARFINHIPIRLPKDRAELEILGGLAARAVDLYDRLNVSRSERDRTQHSRQIETVEREINDRVFALYDVKRAERSEIEELVTEARAESNGEAEGDAADEDTVSGTVDQPVDEDSGEWIIHRPGVGNLQQERQSSLIQG